MESLPFRGLVESEQGSALWLCHAFTTVSCASTLCHPKAEVEMTRGQEPWSFHTSETALCLHANVKAECPRLACVRPGARCAGVRSS